MPDKCTHTTGIYIAVRTIEEELYKKRRTQQNNYKSAHIGIESMKQGYYCLMLVLNNVTLPQIVLHADRRLTLKAHIIKTKERKKLTSVKRLKYCPFGRRSALSLEYKLLKPK